MMRSANPLATRAANVVLDIDGTIVFPEAAEIAVPGRTRSTFVAASTAALLESITPRCNLYLASARNAASVARLVRALPRVAFAGFVLECGLVWRSELHSVPSRPAARRPVVDMLRQRLRDWECVAGYEQMICCIAPRDAESPVEQLAAVLRHGNLAQSWRMHQERHKIFLYPDVLCKVSGLQNLGIGAIDFAAGDDVRYDFSLLSTARYPVTLSSADESLVQLVRSRGGFVATEAGHAGAAQMLSQLDRMLS